MQNAIETDKTKLHNVTQATKKPLNSRGVMLFLEAFKTKNERYWIRTSDFHRVKMAL